MLYNFSSMKHCFETAGFKNVKRLESFEGLPVEQNPSATHWCSLNVIAENEMVALGLTQISISYLQHELPPAQLGA